MEKIKTLYIKMLNFFKKNFTKIIILVEFLVSLAFSYCLLMLMYYKATIHVWHRIYTYIDIALFIILVYLIVNSIKNNRKIENIFLTIAIPISLLFMVMFIPRNVPDETSHIYRAYTVSNGDLIVSLKTQKIKIPSDIKNVTRPLKYKELIPLASKPTNYKSEEVEFYNGAESYSFIMYIFSGFGFFIARLLNLNIYVAIYLARLFNVILFLIGGYYSIKYIPFGKLFIMVYLMNPMFLQQAASISADSFVNTLIIFYFSFFLYLLFLENKVSKRDKYIYFALTVCVSFCKYVYFPMTLISLLLLKSNGFKEEKKDKIFIVLSIIISLIIGLASYYLGSQYKDVRSYVIENKVDSGSQVKYIINNPITFTRTLIKHILTRFKDYVYQFVGGSLGFFKISIRPKVYLSYLFVLLVSPFLEKTKKSLNKFQKLYFIGIFCIIALLIIIGLYLMWTPVGANDVLGVQGRYFIPIVIFLLICLIIKNKGFNFKYTNICIAVFLLLNCSLVLNEIITYFL